jgi:PAS domain S-box-containing protein
MDPMPDSARQSQEDTFERFFNMALDMCCVAGVDGYFKRVNPAFDALGYTRQELLTKSFLAFVHPDDVPATLAEVKKLAGGAKTIRFENRYRCKDGSYRWLSWTSSPDPSGTLFAIARDVTESKLLQGEIERQKHEYQAVFDTLPQIIFLKDRDNGIIRANKAAAESMGLTPADLEGRSTYELYPEHAAKYHRDDLEVIASGKPKLDIVEPYEVAPGDVRWVRTDKTPYRDAKGDIVGVVASVTDVTAWKRGEDERVRLYDKLRELDRLKTEFFANVSHELRTPLTLILGPVHKMLSMGDLPEEARHELELVGRNARILLKGVNDLLDVAKLDAGKMGVQYAPVDFVAMMRTAAAHFESLARDRGMSLLLEMGAPCILGQADAQSLQKALTNVLSNAFKFTPAGGSVRCTVRADPPSDDLPRGAVTFEIADSGPGIDAALREVIFDRFRQAEAGPTRRFGGTGLGLAIVKEVIALHEGHVSAGVAPEGGALFTIQLPLLAPAAVPVAPQATGSTPPPDGALEVLHAQVSAGEGRVVSHLQKATSSEASPGADPRALVLVVEDNVDMNRFVAEGLSTEHRVAVAFDGEQGLAMARALKPDLVVSDVMMPRLDGFSLVRALRADPNVSTIPVVLLTAKTDEASTIAGLGAGADDYLTKPFSLDELNARVRTHLKLAQARRELARRQEEAAQLQLAIQARDEFLSVASHELRTPLSALQLNLQLIEKLAPSDTDQRSALLLGRAIRCCGQLTVLIKSLLDVARAATGHLEILPTEFDFNVLLRRVALRFDAQLADAGCLLEWHLGAPGATAMGRWDSLWMEQVITNLLSNAIKFGAGKPIAITCAVDKEIVRVSVHDHGVGIAPEHHLKVFQRFQQVAPARHHGGLGLGLWIADEIVKRHGGSLRVESQLGDGATFVMELPRDAGGPR